MQREQCLICSRHLLNVCCCNYFHSYIPKVRVVLYIQCLWRKLISGNTGAWIHACGWGWSGVYHYDVSYHNTVPKLQTWHVRCCPLQYFQPFHLFPSFWMPLMSCSFCLICPFSQEVPVYRSPKFMTSCKTWSSMYLLQCGLEPRKRRSFWLGPRLGEGSTPEFIEEVVMSRVSR